VVGRLGDAVASVVGQRNAAPVRRDDLRQIAARVVAYQVHRIAESIGDADRRRPAEIRLLKTVREYIGRAVLELNGPAVAVPVDRRAVESPRGGRVLVDGIGKAGAGRGAVIADATAVGQDQFLVGPGVGVS